MEIHEEEFLRATRTTKNGESKERELGKLKGRRNREDKEREQGQMGGRRKGNKYKWGGDREGISGKRKRKIGNKRKGNKGNRGL